MKKFRVPIPLAGLLVIIGVAGLMRISSHPGFEVYRTVDVGQMTGSAFCFGIAFSMLIVAIVLKQSQGGG